MWDEGRSPVLSKTYRLAALKAAPSTHVWGTKVRDLADATAKGPLEKITKLFLQLSLFSHEPRWRLEASLIEGHLFYPKLKRDSPIIFPRKDMVKDEYLTYIPCTWTTVNNYRGNPLSGKILWEMMVLSMLNYQVGEFMEAVVGEAFKDNLEPVSDLIKDICRRASNAVEGYDMSPETEQINETNGASKERPIAEGNGNVSESANKKRRTNHMMATSSPDLLEIAETLEAFITHQTTYTLVKHSSPSDRKALVAELKTFLLVHVTQIEDNARFSSQHQQQSLDPTRGTAVVSYTPPQTSYFTWVRTTSANHTSCPYSLAYLSCLLGGAANIKASRNGTASGSGGEIRDCFPTAKAKFYSQALCGHLAAMCRQYNDYGSVARDREEGNVNSVNFSEFHNSTTGRDMATVVGGNGDGDGDGDGEGRDERIKKRVREIAQFERECLNFAKEKLDDELDTLGEGMKIVKEAVGVFVDVADLYGQIYVKSDIAAGMK
ncbi:MAG: hypothetical protein Q9181_005339 [Wetmoreana brouardii]